MHTLALALLSVSKDDRAVAAFLNPHHRTLQAGVTLSVMVHGGSKHLELYAKNWATTFAPFKFTERVFIVDGGKNGAYCVIVGGI